MRNDQIHFSNIDWIRALSSIAVVAIHYHVIQTGGIASTGNLIDGYILRLSVPMFMLVSIFLFTSKERNADYLLKKTKTLLFLAFTWSFIFYTLNRGLLSPIEKIIHISKEVSNSPELLIHYFFSDLETVFYFFISLYVVLVIAFLLQNRSTGLIITALILSVLTVGILPFIYNGSIATFYNPLNFIPYAPAAILINRYRDVFFQKNLQIGSGCLLIGLLMILVEIAMALQTNINFINGYTKTSLIFLSIGLLLISLSTKKPNKIVAFMSEHSLPLYLFHTCMFSLVGTITNILFVKFMNVSAYINTFNWLTAIFLCYFISRFIAPRILIPAIYKVG